MNSPLTKKNSPAGFLVVFTLLGMGSGFACVDLFAASAGYRWSSPYYISATIVTLVVGAIGGLIVGARMDAKLSSHSDRAAWLTIIWVFLLIGYTLFELLHPLFESAR